MRKGVPFTPHLSSLDATDLFLGGIMYWCFVLYSLFSLEFIVDWCASIRDKQPSHRGNRFALSYHERNTSYDRIEVTLTRKNLGVYFTGHGMFSTGHGVHFTGHGIFSTGYGVCLTVHEIFSTGYGVCFTGHGIFSTGYGVCFTGHGVFSPDTG